MITALFLCSLLATGAQLDSAGRTIDLGNMPLSMTLTPEGDRAVVVLSGQHEMGVQIVDLAAGAVVQTIPLTSAFLGAAFSPDGRRLYISGGNDDVVHSYAWNGREATFERDISLKVSAEEAKGSRYPAGIAVSHDGRWIYVAENVADDVAVIDATSSNVTARIKTDILPYAIAVAPNDDVFVSAWGADTVSVLRGNAALTRIVVGRHPSALRLDAAGSKLYVALASVDQIAVVDTGTMKRTGAIEDRTPAGPHEGVTPNALALSPDGARLYVAEGDDNAVAVFDTSSRKRLGRIPAGWYPSDVIAGADRLLILNSKGRGSLANRGASQPSHKINDQYVLSRINGTISVVDHPLSRLAAMTQRVTKANHWRAVEKHRAYPPFKHVIYVIKENRTFDQVFGDMPAGDTDPALVFFGRQISRIIMRWPIASASSIGSSPVARSVSRATSGRRQRMSPTTPRRPCIRRTRASVRMSIRVARMTRPRDIYGRVWHNGGSRCATTVSKCIRRKKATRRTRLPSRRTPAPIIPVSFSTYPISAVRISGCMSSRGTP
jgi:YVTN family beta-propeller protein